MQAGHVQAGPDLADEYELPDDFISESMAKIAIHVRRGFWVQAKVTIDEIERLWKSRQQDEAIDVQAHKLAMHVSWLRLDARIVGLIETVCCGTVGSLLECFPSAFVKKRDCGPVTAERISKALLRAGIIDATEAQRRFDQFVSQWWKL